MKVSGCSRSRPLKQTHRTQYSSHSILKIDHKRRRIFRIAIEYSTWYNLLTFHDTSFYLSFTKQLEEIQGWGFRVAADKRDFGQSAPAVWLPSIRNYYSLAFLKAGVGFKSWNLVTVVTSSIFLENWRSWSLYLWSNMT